VRGSAIGNPSSEILDVCHGLGGSAPWAPNEKVAAEVALSVEYMYAFALRQGENALIVIRFDDMARAAKVLEASGIGILRAADFYQHE